MLIFVDESGDPGFQIHKGSSPVFVIALVIFDDELEAEKCAVSIKELKRRLRFPDTTEFKFNKSRPAIIKAFLETVSVFKFRVRAIVVKKREIISMDLKKDKTKFFNYFIRMVLENHKGTIKNAKLRLDRRGERLVRNELRTYLSRQLNNKKTNLFRDFKFVDSKQNVLVQLADMVAGSIACTYKEKDRRFLTILKTNRKIQDIWEFK